MRILSIHNRYQIRGGEDECLVAEVALLREMGHQVDIYEENNDRIAERSSVDLALTTIWSEESHRTVQQMLQKTIYDVVHIHNFFPLISPSVHYAVKASGVPVVQTLHNYRLLCSNALFFRGGRVCEDCLGKPIPYPGVLHGCYRENRVASAAVAAMITAHRAMQTWTKQVDLFVTLTEFARQKFIQGGLPAEKIVIKPNFVSFDPGVGDGAGGYALFVGRLSVEKGLDVLLNAWQQLGQQIPLKLVGDGPLSEQVKAAAQHSNVEWLGRRPMTEVYDLMGSAKFLVFPSRWYETFGRVAVESFAKGTPVIAAEIGAIAELIDSGRTGLLYDPNSPSDLITKVEWMLSHPSQLAQMRQEARAEFETKYTAQRNYQYLMDIYDKARSKV